MASLDTSLETCAICLELLSVNPPLETLPCAHQFHHACMKQMRSFRSHRLQQRCPTCRAPLPRHRLFVDKCEDLVTHVFGDNADMRLEAMRQIRTLLAAKRDMRIIIVKMLIETDTVPHLVKILDDDTNRGLQLEASWVFTNISADTAESTCKVLIDNGLIPIIMRLLHSRQIEEPLRENLAWTIGNIAGDSNVNCGRIIIEAGAIRPLMEHLICATSPTSYKRVAAWAIGNLCRHLREHASISEVTHILLRFTTLLSSLDLEVLEQTCWALSWLTGGDMGSADYIQDLVQAEVIDKVVELLVDRRSARLVWGAARLVGIIVSGNDHQTQVAVDCGCIIHMKALLLHKKGTIRKDCAWGLSNICSGTQVQRQAVLDANLIPVLLYLVIQDNFVVKLEAAYVIKNLLRFGPAEITNHTKTLLHKSMAQNASKTNTEKNVDGTTMTYFPGTTDALITRSNILPVMVKYLSEDQYDVGIKLREAVIWRQDIDQKLINDYDFLDTLTKPNMWPTPTQFSANLDISYPDYVSDGTHRTQQAWRM